MLLHMCDSSRTETVVITTDGCDASQRARLSDMAERFQIALSEEVPSDRAYLRLEHERLVLCDPTMTGASGVWIDLIDAMRKASRGGRKRDHPLVRAVGRTCKRVIDATAGLGGDTALLLGFGFDVLAIERVGALAAMLTDALRRAEEHGEFDPPLRERLLIQHGDARNILHSLQDTFDAVLIDPMFPPKRKSSALANKNIRIVRAIAGDDPDADELLNAARSSGAQRVVVKRPPYAPPLAPNPSAEYKSKLVRYDVYVRA